MKKIIFFTILSILLVGCNDEKTSVEEKDTGTEQLSTEQQSEQTTPKEDVVDVNANANLSDRINLMFDQLNGLIPFIPIIHEGYGWTPYSTQTISMTEDGEIHGTYSYKVDDYAALAYMDSVTVDVIRDDNPTFDNFTQSPNNDRIWINDQTGEVAYQNRSYLVTLRPILHGENNSVVTDVLTQQAVIEVQTEPTFAEMLFQMPSQINIPTYLLNEEKALTLSASTSVQINNQYTQLTPLSYSIANEDVRVTMTDAEQLVDYGFDQDNLECCMELTTLGGIEGYYDPNDQLGFYFEKGKWKYYIRPGQDVNEATGQVTPKYLDNWQETIEEIVTSIQ